MCDSMAVEARKWERGVAGSCNVVHFDGSDIVGVAHFCREDEANLACDLTAQLAAVTAERDELREENAALRNGAPLGPIVGADTILVQQNEIKRLRELVEEVGYLEYWACMTGDCDHDHANDCLALMREHLEGLASKAAAIINSPEGREGEA